MGDDKMCVPLLSIKNLSAWYDSEKMALKGLTLELAEHEVVGLIGLNGAGKTTFLQVLSGLLPTFRSDGVWFCGRSVTFRERNFKLCRYSVFAEDNSFQYFQHMGTRCPMFQSWCRAFTLKIIQTFY